MAAFLLAEGCGGAGGPRGIMKFPLLAGEGGDVLVTGGGVGVGGRNG